MPENRSVLIDKRIALLTNIPRPYRAPLYEALNRQIQSLGGKFQVFFYSDVARHARRKGAQDLAGDYASVNAAGLEIPLGYERMLSIPWKLPGELARFSPDLVIAGTFGIAGYLSWAYTRLKKIPYVQWSGAIQQEGKRGASLAQRVLARRSEACLTYGSMARDYLVAAGAQPARIVAGVNAVDSLHFEAKSAEARAQAIAYKKERGLEGVQLLYAGSFVPRKGHSLLVEALSALKRRGIESHIHFAGAGPLEAEIKSQVESEDLTDRFHFWGSQPPERMPFFYSLADIFVFPTLHDVWGLVLNEAMTCGLPVIASCLAGATRDLVEDGANGLVVDPRDVNALAEALRKLIANPDLRRRMGAAARDTICRKATIQHSAVAFMQVIELALD